MISFVPETIVIDALPSLALTERVQLPNESALYFVLNATNEVLYLGRAKSLKARWRNHHRLADFMQKTDVRIAWVTVSDHYLLPAIEDACLAYFQPTFNRRTTADYVAMMLRLPPALAAAIKERAALARRPINTESIILLEQALQEDDQSPARPRRAIPVGAPP